MIIEEAINEVRFGYENGASAVFWRGFENGRTTNDPYFAPLFEEINRLGLALGVHAANGTFEIHDAFPDDNGIFRFKVPGITAFQTVLSSGLATRYPNIRFGFIELASQWVPYALHDFVRRASRAGKDIDPTTLMKENRIYVACQTDDDLAYVMKYAGPDNLVSGTDFGHADTSSELLALQRLREIGAVAPELIDRILDENPKALYNLA
jgi:predicted TIM-barrel fold metal-dependent hydrolase